MQRLGITIPVLTGLFAAMAMACGASSKNTAAPPEGGQPTQSVAATRGANLPLQVPAEGAYASQKYRNLFADLGKPEAEVKAKLAKAYQQLFHGNPESEAVMFPAGSNANGPMAYVMDINNNDIRSEGMSYGMMIAVQYDNKADFDAIWNWAKTTMYHGEPTHPAYGYFSWQMKPDGKAMDEMPAPDGEEYFAMALLFAAHRWGSGQGIYDYQKEALTLLDHMKNRGSISGTVNGGRQTTAVALFNPEHKMVRFTPDTGNFEKNGDHTDPSYHLPAFYELWALWGPPADRSFWAEAAQASRDVFVKTTHPTTGLSPDYAQFDGSPKAASWDAGTVNFRYDAFRTAMNWSMDMAWWAKDPRQTELSNRLLAFFASQSKPYFSNFTLDGKPTNSNEALGLVATNAVAALAATDPRAWQFVEALYDREPPTGKYRYYDGLLYTMAMLHVSGNFRIYMPNQVSQPAVVK